MASVLKLQALSVQADLMRGSGCYSHVTSYAGTCGDNEVF